MKKRMRALLVIAAAAMAVALAAGLGLQAVSPAAAASLVQVANFGNNPSNLQMYVYVPDSVTVHPAILLAPHWCGGSGPAMFSGSEFASLASQYGFIVSYPSVTRSDHCWDVSSSQALTRNGGSDPVGIMSMITYAEQHYPADQPAADQPSPGQLLPCELHNVEPMARRIRG